MTAIHPQTYLLIVCNEMPHGPRNDFEFAQYTGSDAVSLIDAVNTGWSSPTQTAPPAASQPLVVRTPERDRWSSGGPAEEGHPNRAECAGCQAPPKPSGFGASLPTRAAAIDF